MVEPPIWKILVKWDIFPRGEHKTCLKPNHLEYSEQFEQKNNPKSGHHPHPSIHPFFQAGFPDGFRHFAGLSQAFRLGIPVDTKNRDRAFSAKKNGWKLPQFGPYLGFCASKGNKIQGAIFWGENKRFTKQFLAWKQQFLAWKMNLECRKPPRMIIQYTREI